MGESLIGSYFHRSIFAASILAANIFTTYLVDYKVILL